MTPDFPDFHLTRIDVTQARQSAEETLSATALRVAVTGSVFRRQTRRSRGCG
jgi:ATP phosphoribosyltransferase regulatory subunit HisZ